MITKKTLGDNKYTMNIKSLCLFITTLLIIAIAVNAQSLDVLEDSIKATMSKNQQKAIPFKVKNTGSTQIELEFDTSKLDLIDNKGEKIKISFDPTSPTINPGNTSTIEMILNSDMYISFERFGGNLIVKDKNSKAQDTVNLIIDIEPDVCDFGIVGSDLKIDIKEPDSSDEFKPGDIIDIEVEVSNEGKNDMRVQVDAFLFNEKRNIADASSSSKKIEDGEEEDFNLELRIPIDPNDINDEDTFTLYIKAYDDNFEELNCIQAKQDIDIELEDEEVIIDKKESRIFPPAAACGDTISAYVKVINIGSKDNDDVVIKIENQELGIYEQSEKFELEDFNSEEDNTLIKQFQIKIPEDAKISRYNLKAIVNYDGGSNSIILPLEIVSCDLQSILLQKVNPITIKKLESEIMTKKGSLVTIPLQISNNLNRRVNLIITPVDTEDFAESSSKTASLNPDSRTTVLLDLLIRDKANPGTYSSTILVKEGAKTLASETIIINIEDIEEEKAQITTPGLLKSIPLSIWIIINLFLIAVVLLSLKMVLTSRRK